MPVGSAPSPQESPGTYSQAGSSSAIVPLPTGPESFVARFLETQVFAQAFLFDHRFVNDAGTFSVLFRLFKKLFGLLRLIFVLELISDLVQQHCEAFDALHRPPKVILARFRNAGQQS